MNETVTIRWLGHSCFRMEYAGFSLVTDPYEDGYIPGLAPLHVGADAVYCSHGHGDHSAAACVKQTREKAPPDFSVQEFAVPHDHHGGARRGMNTIRQFRFGRLRVVHMGDTGCMPEESTLAALHGCDALLLPIGGYYTVDAEEAFAIAKKIAPRCIVPMHYRGEGFGFDELGTLDAFTGLFAAADVRFLETDAFTLTAAEPRGVIVPRLL